MTGIWWEEDSLNVIFNTIFQTFILHVARKPIKK